MNQRNLVLSIERLLENARKLSHEFKLLEDELIEQKQRQERLQSEFKSLKSSKPDPVPKKRQKIVVFNEFLPEENVVPNFLSRLSKHADLIYFTSSKQENLKLVTNNKKDYIFLYFNSAAGGRPEDIFNNSLINIIDKERKLGFNEVGKKAEEFLKDFKDVYIDFFVQKIHNQSFDPYKPLIHGFKSITIDYTENDDNYTFGKEATDHFFARFSGLNGNHDSNKKPTKILVNYFGKSDIPIMELFKKNAPNMELTFRETNPKDPKDQINRFNFDGIDKENCIYVHIYPFAGRHWDAVRNKYYEIFKEKGMGSVETKSLADFLKDFAKVYILCLKSKNPFDPEITYSNSDLEYRFIYYKQENGSYIFEQDAVKKFFDELNK